MRRMLSDGRSYIEDTMQLPALPEKPEPPRPEKVWIEKPQALKKLRWTEAQFDEAQKFGFPASGKRIKSGQWGVTLIWEEGQIDRWIADTRTKAAAMLGLVGKAK